VARRLAKDIFSNTSAAKFENLRIWTRLGASGVDWVNGMIMHSQENVGDDKGLDADEESPGSEDNRVSISTVW
jgi:hypothetical protein